MATPKTPGQKIVSAAVDVAVNTLVAGSGMGVRGALEFFDEPRSTGWAPTVPLDMHTAKLPEVAQDGTAECWRCKQRFPFAVLDIVDQAYSCRPCGVRTQMAPVVNSTLDVEHMKIGRGHWWVLPLCAAVAAGLVAVALAI